MADRTAPADHISGADPAITVTAASGEAVVVRCSACTWADAYIDEDAATNAARHHHLFAHPAYRNPDITCLVREMGDDRICVRAKDHDGDHWTPSFHGGLFWPRRDWDTTESMADWMATHTRTVQPPGRPPG